MKSIDLLALSAILLTSHTLGAQEFYRLETGRVILDQLEHFDQWSRADGTVDLAVDEISGAFEGLSPRLWRRNVDALQADIVANLRANPPKRLENVDPAEFTILDAVQTGQLNSKLEVLKVFDGDPNTYWEPVFPQERSADIIGAEAFFTIDLGAAVTTDKIVLKFADELNGDPFLLFDVFTSDGVNPIARAVGIFGESPEYRRVFATLQPNKSQREFEIDLSGFDNVTDARRKLVHFIKVVVNGSAFERGSEVTQEEYESLRQVAAQDTGLVEYTRRLSSGSLIEVEQNVWEDLQGDNKGPIRYWKRERPRLAEVQVWAQGEDMFHGVPQRCTLSEGCVSVSPKVPGGVEGYYATQLTDGNLDTQAALDLDPGIASQPDLLRNVTVDLGSMFWVSTYQHTIRMNIGHSATLGPWSLDFSDGSLASDGTKEWTRVFTVEQEVVNVLGDSRIEAVNFDPVRARFMKLEWLQSNTLSNPGNDVNLTEMQLLGEGYQPEVSMVSDAIVLPGNSNLVSIEWDADTPPGTSVLLQTRTGTELDQKFCFYKIFGGSSRPMELGNPPNHCALEGTPELDALNAKFPKPGPGAKPDRIDTVPFLDESKFSAWSEAYADPAGSAITSPSPRPVLLISATLTSDDPDAHATLRSVRLNFDEPVANRLLGSLTPTRVGALAVDQAFSLVVQLGTLQLGLDELLLLPPPGMELLRDPAPILYGGTLQQLQEGQDMSDRSLAANLLVPREGTAVGDSLYLSFSEINRGAAFEAVRLDFTGRLFSPGGRMGVQLRNATSSGANWQRVDQESNSLIVVAEPQQKELFRDLAIVPAVFTPNGDDRNEQTNVTFTLLSVGVGTGVAVEVYDLSGRLVRRLDEQRDNSTGSYAIPWDGLDARGNLVAPGMYAVRVKLAGATSGSGLDQVEQLRTVAVAY